MKLIMSFFILYSLASETPNYYSDLSDLKQFKAMAGNNNQENVYLVKYSIDFDGQKDIYFQNTKKYPFHYKFISENVPKYFNNLSFEKYSQLIYGDTMAAGTLVYSNDYQLNPGQSSGTIAMELYLGGPNITITPQIIIDNLEKITQSYKKMTSALSFAPVVFVISGNAATSDQVKQQLGQLNIPFIANNGPNSDYVKYFLKAKNMATYNPGKSYGYLKSVSNEDLEKSNYTDRDILILKNIPLDIGPSAGIISSTPQTPLSHVILRSINQNIPNIYLVEPLSRNDIAKNMDKLVEFQVYENNRYKIRGEDEIGKAKLEALAKEYFSKRIPKIKDPAFEKTNTLFSWSEATSSRSLVTKYGAKGANFAFLNNKLKSRQFDRSLFDGGFLIPLQYYEEHITQKLSPRLCNKAQKKCTKEKHTSCIDITNRCLSFADQSMKDFISSSLDHLEQSTNEAKFSTLTFIRELIEKAPIDHNLVDQVKSILLESYPDTRRIRFRSSTNVEDLPGLNGAGLYSSKSGCIADETKKSKGPSQCTTQIELKRIQKRISQLEKFGDKADQEHVKKLTKKMTDKNYIISKSIRKVYASLWNAKAYLDREYYKIDHLKAKMGILVHPSFINESANGVLIITKEEDHFKIKISAQDQDISITNPITKNARAEIIELTMAGNEMTRIHYKQHSNIKQGSLVLSKPQVKQLSQQSIHVFNSFLEDKRPGEKLHTLDIEFIVDEFGTVLIKQARPLNIPKSKPKITTTPNPLKMMGKIVQVSDFEKMHARYCLDDEEHKIFSMSNLKKDPSFFKKLFQVEKNDFRVLESDHLFLSTCVDSNDNYRLTVGFSHRVYLGAGGWTSFYLYQVIPEKNPLYPETFSESINNWNTSKLDLEYEVKNYSNVSRKLLMSRIDKEKLNLIYNTPFDNLSSDLQEELRLVLKVPDEEIKKLLTPTLSNIKIKGFLENNNSLGVAIIYDDSAYAGLLRTDSPWAQKNRSRQVKRELNLGKNRKMILTLNATGVYGQYQSYEIEELIIDDPILGIYKSYKSDIDVEIEIKMTHHGLNDQILINVGNTKYEIGSGKYMIKYFNTEPEIITDKNCLDLTKCGSDPTSVEPPRPWGF